MEIFNRINLFRFVFLYQVKRIPEYVVWEDIDLSLDIINCVFNYLELQNSIDNICIVEIAGFKSIGDGTAVG
jgi:hypothetical protein